VKVGRRSVGKGQQGLTLIEVAVVLAIAGLVALAIFGLFRVGFALQRRSSQAIAAGEAAIALDVIVRTLRETGREASVFRTWSTGSAGGQYDAVAVAEIRDHCLPGVMLASNTEIWFRTPGSRLEFIPCGQNEALLRIGLPDTLRLTIGDAHGAARFQGLRQFGVGVEQVRLDAIPAEAPPAIDVEALQRRARTNEANAALNRAAGEAAERPDLRDKRHSLYTAEEFAVVLRYLRGRQGVLVGAVYVGGNVLIQANVPLMVSDGFLALEGALIVEAGGRLTVRHSRSARLLPGFVTIGKGGTLILGEGSRVEVEGVVASEGLVDLRDGSSLEVAGAVLAVAPQFSLRLNNATLKIRYDPQVLGTVGLPATGARRRVVSVSWQELR